MKITIEETTFAGKLALRAVVVRRHWLFWKRTSHYLCTGVGVFSATWIDETTGERVWACEELYDKLNAAGAAWQIAKDREAHL